MARDRVICSHEKQCGCVHTPKHRGVPYGENVINPAMKNCARFIKTMGDKYCCLTREVVHIIK